MNSVSHELVDEAVSRTVELCRIPSPTGFTREAERYVFDALSAMGLKPEYTVKRSVRVCLGGQGRPLVLAAHVDTLGAMVRSVKPNGALRLAKLGGFPENYIEGENCTVHTRDGKTFSGRFLLDKPGVHVNKETATAKRDDTGMELVLDEETRSAADTKALGVGPGDFVSFDARTVLTPSGFIKSRHLDDKASSGVLLALAAHIARQKPALNRQLWLLFTNYEEVGHGGAAGLPEGVEEIISVDMGVLGDDLSASEYCVSICAKDSNGPYDYELTNELIRLAREHGIEHAVDIYPFYGSDADAALSAGYDIRHGLIGPGVYASHGYERTHKKGLASTLALLMAYLNLLNGD